MFYLARPAVAARSSPAGFSFSYICSGASLEKGVRKRFDIRRMYFGSSNGGSDKNFSKMSNSILESVSQSDAKILQEVLDLVKAERLLCDAADPDSQKVIEFVHPKDLEQCLGGLEIGSGPTSEDDIRDLMGRVVRYSVKTCHHRFYNQVKIPHNLPDVTFDIFTMRLYLLFNYLLLPLAFTIK